MTKMLRTHLLLKFLFVLVISISTFITFSSVTKVYAQTDEEGVCSLSAAIYEWGWLGEAARSLTLSFCNVRDTIETISNPSTVLDTMVSNLVAVPFFILFNSNVSQLSLCGVYFLDNINAGGSDQDLLTDLNDINGSNTPLASQDMRDAAEEYANGGGCDFDSVASINSRARGSLWGVTQLAVSAAVTESAPVNLAYFAKHTAQKVPIINRTAFAQIAEYNTSWGLELIIGFWEKMRNFALVIISVIMLIIGILIMSRSKIGPQTAVTVQYAIPRIIISLFLIAFSYPIGAFFVNAIIPLTFVAVRVLIDPVQVIEFIQNLGKVLVMNLVINLTTFGAAGITSMLMASFALIGVILSILIAAVKLILIQTKMLVSIVMSPLIFAIGAIPGQDDIIKNWFKQMIAKMIAVPATIFVLLLGILLFVTPYFDITILRSLLMSVVPRDVTGPQIIFSIMGFTSNLISLTMLPIMSTIVIFSSIGIDKKVTEMITGDGGKKRR